MAETEESETVEGTVWPMVVLVELGTSQIAALRAELESASMIVLIEGSMLRAAQLIAEQRPHAVVAPSSLPVERTQVMRDAAKEIGIEVVLVGSGSSAPEIGAILHDVRAAVARVTAKRASRR